MSKLAVFTVALLALAAGVQQATAALSLAEFLSDPRYSLFVLKALQTSCTSDPAVGSGAFDILQCPSLLGMLDAVNAGVTDYPSLTCEPSCEQTLYTLQPDCISQLTAAFNDDTTPFGMMGSNILAQCADLHDNAGAPPPETFAPSPAPTPSPSVAPSPAV